MKWHEIRKIGSGLVNLGNTCFLNSVLQCLTYVAPFANFCTSREHSKQCQLKNGWCAFCSLESHISKSLTSHGKTVGPNEIAKHLPALSKKFKIGRQEDAHELLRFLLDSCQKSAIGSLEQ